MWNVFHFQIRGDRNQCGKKEKRINVMRGKESVHSPKIVGIPSVFMNHRAVLNMMEIYESNGMTKSVAKIS